MLPPTRLPGWSPHSRSPFFKFEQRFIRLEYQEKSLGKAPMWPLLRDALFRFIARSCKPSLVM